MTTPAMMRADTILTNRSAWMTGYYHLGNEEVMGEELRDMIVIQIEEAEEAERADAKRLRDAVDHVLRVFEKDEAQGCRSKDRQFAIEILRKALEMRK